MTKSYDLKDALTYDILVGSIGKKLILHTLRKNIITGSVIHEKDVVTIENCNLTKQKTNEFEEMSDITNKN